MWCFKLAGGGRTALSALLGLLLLWPGIAVAVAPGATITVCPSGCMFTRIQDGINNAAAGDTVSVSAGVYSENLQLRAGVVVEGADAATTIVDAGQRNSVVRATLSSIGVSTVVRRLTLRNGRAPAGAGVLIQAAAPTLEDLIIENNQASGTGGGIAVLGGGRVVMTDSILRNNVAGTTGGAAFFDALTFGAIRSSDLLNNQAQNGGGLYSANATVTISDTLFSTNQAAQHGGGAVFAQGSGGEVQFSTFENNVAVAGHGGASGHRRGRGAGWGQHRAAQQCVSQQPHAGVKCHCRCGENLLRGYFTDRQ